jgi:hypothetical protein
MADFVIKYPMGFIMQNAKKLMINLTKNKTGA